ncbi:MAG: tetratricopeptide repeat protein [Pseudomonadota bacterium]|nr:tetratricopeptide repeat protein [Pseudomonadota bacterium]
MCMIDRVDAVARAQRAWQKVTRGLCVLLAMGASGGALGAEGFAKTPQEEAMCNAAIYRGRDTSDRNNWQHMHHYCDCLRFARRAMTQPAASSARSHNISRALDGCDYVLDHTSSGFYMQPAVRASRAYVLMLDKRYRDAVAEYERALRQDPNYLKAYMGLFDAWSAAGDLQSARKAAERGLAISPNSKALQRRLRKVTQEGEADG